MATAKRTTKKPTVKRAPAKSASTTKVTHRAAPKHEEMRSFHRAEPEAFFTFRINRQTLYWTVIGLAVLVIGVWVLSINIQVNDIYDQVDTRSQSTLYED